MDREYDVIIKVGGEGGSIALEGWKDSEGNWEYSVAINEYALCDLLDDEDKHLLEYEPEKNRETVHSWEEAIKLFNKYSWRELRPMRVHEEFKEKVWNEVQLNSKRHIERWRRVCSLKNQKR